MTILFERVVVRHLINLGGCCRACTRCSRPRVHAGRSRQSGLVDCRLALLSIWRSGPGHRCPVRGSASNRLTVGGHQHRSPSVPNEPKKPLGGTVSDWTSPVIVLATPRDVARPSHFKQGRHMRRSGRCSVWLRQGPRNCSLLLVGRLRWETPFLEHPPFVALEIRVLCRTGGGGRRINFCCQRIVERR